MNTQLLIKTKEAFIKRGFDAYVAKSGEEALALALSLIPKEESVTFGGSQSIKEIGLISALKEEGYTVFDRSPLVKEERERFMREHYFSDWYLMSANAVTEDGMLLNLDGIGNRVASLIYGPKNVLVVVGVNKITSDVPAAYKRVREIAAPRNAHRFDIQTPCKQTGSCADCLSPDTICSQMVLTRVCRPKNRIKVILIDGVYGF